jgi:hypothetical protein
VLNPRNIGLNESSWCSVAVGRSAVGLSRRVAPRYAVLPLYENAVDITNNAAVTARRRGPHQNVGATPIGLRGLVQWFVQIV